MKLRRSNNLAIYQSFDQKRSSGYFGCFEYTSQKGSIQRKRIFPSPYIPQIEWPAGRVFMEDVPGYSFYSIRTLHQLSKAKGASGISYNFTPHLLKNRL